MQDAQPQSPDDLPVAQPRLKSRFVGWPTVVYLLILLWHFVDLLLDERMYTAFLTLTVGALAGAFEYVLFLQLRTVVGRNDMGNTRLATLVDRHFFACLMTSALFISLMVMVVASFYLRLFASSSRSGWGLRDFFVFAVLGLIVFGMFSAPLARIVRAVRRHHEGKAAYAIWCVCEEVSHPANALSSDRSGKDALRANDRDGSELKKQAGESKTERPKVAASRGNEWKQWSAKDAENREAALAKSHRLHHNQAAEAPHDPMAPVDRKAKWLGSPPD